MEIVFLVRVISWIVLPPPEDTTNFNKPLIKRANPVGPRFRFGVICNLPIERAEHDPAA
jgi:hypothetical protein